MNNISKLTRACDRTDAHIAFNAAINEANDFYQTEHFFANNSVFQEHQVNFSTVVETLGGKPYIATKEQQLNASYAMFRSYLALMGRIS